MKKVHRLWCEEGLQVRIHSPRKRAGTSSVPEVIADAPKVVWAIDFQFDSTVEEGDQDRVDGRRAHPRVAAESGGALDHRRTARGRTSAGVRRGGRSTADAADGQWSGVDFSSTATVLREQGRLVLYPARTPWNNGYIESFNNRLRKECLNRNHWTTLFEARVVIGDFKDDHNHRHRHSALGYRTPAEYAARCSHTHYPVACEIN